MTIQIQEIKLLTFLHLINPSQKTKINIHLKQTFLFCFIFTVVSDTEQKSIINGTFRKNVKELLIQRAVFAYSLSCHSRRKINPLGEI